VELGYRVGSFQAQPGDRTSVVVIDPAGTVFAKIRDLALPVSLWRLVDERRLPSFSGIDLVVCAVYQHVDWALVRGLRRAAPTLVMTTAFSRDDATKALYEGLIGYIDAGLEREALRRTICGAVRGEPAYGREVTGAWLRARRQAELEADAQLDLTPRQRQIVTLIARGATDKEIGGELGIATATAQKHVTNILERLRVPNRAAAVAVVAARAEL
jgi:DNA-binding NarL/FixJ family response regulator